MTGKEYINFYHAQNRNVLLSYILILFLVFFPLVVLTPNTFLSPTNVYAATSPSLGMADTFGILSSTYTNTVSGTSITGDLGYTTGPTVAPTVSGTTYVADGTYNTAGADQSSALANLNGQTCTHTFPDGAIDLATDTTHGTVGVYLPGVYCTGAASAASIGVGGITLSGSGTYIFKITGALTTVDNSAVSLDNGASSCDVFWAPVGATTLGANSTFVGTNIDDAGITIGSTVTWNGRALAFGGTVTTDVDTISTTCVVAPTPTPTPTTTPTPTVAPTASTTTTTSSTESKTSSTPCPPLDEGIVTPDIIESRRVDENSIYISWGPYSGTDEYIVSFGPTDGDWLYSTDVTGFSTTLSSLPTNQSMWVRVAARNYCQIGEYGPSKQIGVVARQSSPGLPDTGSPRLPDTGFGTRPRLNIL
jgi:hypothetical protein